MLYEMVVSVYEIENTFKFTINCVKRKIKNVMAP